MNIICIGGRTVGTERGLGSRADVPGRRVQRRPAPPAPPEQGGAPGASTDEDKSMSTTTIADTDDRGRRSTSCRSTPSARSRSMRSQRAKSGHPGTPMALAPLVYTIWNRVMRFDPADPIWPNRDRFVLSNGHASMLLWSVLHLTGTRAVNAEYERLGQPSVTLDDIRRFRQIDSKAPGHPEYHWVSGVETTTGPARAGRRDERGHGHRPEVARRPLQPAGLRDLRLRHLRRVRRRLPDGGRRRPKRPRSPATSASTTSAGSTTTTTSRSKGTRASPSPRTSPRASSATAGTSCASATPTTSSASSRRSASSARRRAVPR